MQAANNPERSQKKKDFIISYSVFVILLGICFYLSFGLIPRVDSKYTSVTNEQLQGFLNHLNETEGYLGKLEAQKPINQTNALAVFSQMAQLKSAYPQNFFQTTLKSYEMRLKEDINLNPNDSTIVILKTKLQNLNTENKELEKEKTLIIEKIKESKTNVQ